MSALLHRQLLDSIQRETFGYFMHESNPANGLIKDKTSAESPTSIAAIGLALAAYRTGVETGLLRRDEDSQRTLATLRFFQQSEQGTGPDATG
ncbi:MAG TPA: hypothetical protein VMW65_00315 [Chloroflexota bacterium]|nr:hypothetical protein [Chloroflexota bacterium]